MSTEKEPEVAGMLMGDVKYKEKPGLSKEKVIVIVILVLGLILFIVGVALIATAVSKKCKEVEGTEGGTSQQSNPACEFSEEAKRVGLEKFLEEVKATFYKLHPYEIPVDPDVNTERVRNEYYAYDPSPETIKSRTDRALELLKKISDTKIETDLLKPRERKALAQVKHYLKHVFGQPYDVNYYAGDWMLGPNLFCWQPVCNQGHDIHNALPHLKPKDLADVENLRKKLESHKNGTIRYIKNMKLGVKSGMVRSVEECTAGVNAIKRDYLNISLSENATGEPLRYVMTSAQQVHSNRSVQCFRSPNNLKFISVKSGLV